MEIAGWPLLALPEAGWFTPLFFRATTGELRMYGVHSRVSEQAWLGMYRAEARAEQGGKCAYCHEPISLAKTTADHVKARIKGGTTTNRKNIKAACEPCNKTKDSMLEAAFLRAIKNPQPGDSIYIWLAWSRRRIWLATERVCKRIMGMVE